MADGKFVAYYRISVVNPSRTGGLEAQQAAVQSFLSGGNRTLLGPVVPERRKSDAAGGIHRG